MNPSVVGVPIKPFGVAKARLGPVVGPELRAKLGKAIAHHTLNAISASGVHPHVVTGDADVAAWSLAHEWPVLEEHPGRGLDGAAAAVAEAAGTGSWAVVHADLPTVLPSDFSSVWVVLGPYGAVAPSRNGGTSVLAASGAMSFSYGPGSFHRHRRVLTHGAVVVRPGLALDLDTHADLDLALQRPQGAWLRRILGT